MYADNQFLASLANKLIAISGSCVDEDTKFELDELIDSILDQMYFQKLGRMDEIRCKQMKL